MDEPPVQEKVHIIFELFMYYNTQTCSNQFFFYVLWTVSMCTTSLHSKFCKIVLWYECTRIIWMDYKFKLFCTTVVVTRESS
jgi:hypothetical protein